MRMPTQFPTAYGAVLGDELFSGSSGTAIDLQEIYRYCGFRFDDDENALSSLEKEEETWRLLSGESPPRRLYVVGAAGSGKSTFLRFLFDFYRHYEGLVKTYGLTDAVRQLLDKSSIGVAKEMYCIVRAEIPDLSDPEEGVRRVCSRIRDEVLALHRNLLYENDGAFFHSEWNVEAPVPANLTDRLRTQAQEIRGPGDASLEFCKIAFRYLRFHRRPESERRRIIVVVDDSDLLGSDYVATVANRLEALVTEPAAGQDKAGTPLSFVFSVRPDTFRLRGYHHVSLRGSQRVDVGTADHKRILKRRSVEFVDVIAGDCDDLFDEIQADGFAVYYVPIPAPVVPDIAYDIADAASGLQDKEPNLRPAYTKIITPLIGRSIRRAQAFQRRIAHSPAIEERARARVTPSNYDIIRGVVTGFTGSSRGLLDIDGVGEWYPPSQTSWRRFLASSFVIGTLKNSRSGEGAAFVVEESGKLLGFLGIADVVVELARHGYIERPSDDGVFAFERKCIQALWELIIHPAYIDICVHRVFGSREVISSGRRVSSASDLEQAVAHASRMVQFVAGCESQWMQWLSGEATCGSRGQIHHEIESCFRGLQIPKLGKAIWTAYLERLDSLKEILAIGDEIRAVAEKAAIELRKIEPGGRGIEWGPDDLLR